MTRADGTLAREVDDWRSLNARIVELEGERSDARDQARLLSALHDTFTRITATRNVDEIVAHTLRAAHDPLGFSRAIYFDVAPDGAIEARSQIDGSDHVEPSTEVAEMGLGGVMSRLSRGDETRNVGIAGELSAPLVDVRGWYVTSALAHGGDVLGILYVDGHGSRFPREWESGLIASLTAIAATSIDNSVLFAKTHELALRDPLTGLYNRRAFSERLATEIDAMRRHGRALAYVMIDVDDFKKINDKHGHAYGDTVLKNLARTLTQSSRSQDVVGRYAGDEFVVLLVDVAPDVAKMLVSRLSSDLQSAGISCSLGAASAPRDASDAVTLLSAADRALYVTKAMGKNGFSFA